MTQLEYWTYFLLLMLLGYVVTDIFKKLRRKKYIILKVKGKDGVFVKTVKIEKGRNREVDELISQIRKKAI